MTLEEAKKILLDVSYALGNMGVEYLSEKDGEKMREAIQALEQQDYDLDGYSSRLWHNAYERGKTDTEAKVLDAIKEIQDLFKSRAAYVPNYDAYGLCLSIICKHMEIEE